MWGKLPCGRRRRKREDPRQMTRAGRSAGRTRGKPQASRGDLYTLTAATFTVLTGFTRSGPTGLGRSEGTGPARRGQRASIGHSRSGGYGTSGTVGVERARNVLDDHLPAFRPGDGYDIESKRAAGAGVHSHPGGSGSGEVPSLGRGDGFRGRLRTRPTCLDLDECDLATAGSDKVDFEAPGTPVSREYSISSPTQQARGEILSPAPQRLAVPEQPDSPIDQDDLHAVRANRHGRTLDQPGINVPGSIRLEGTAARRAVDRSPAPRSPVRRARRIRPAR